VGTPSWVFGEDVGGEMSEGICFFVCKKKMFVCLGTFRWFRDPLFLWAAVLVAVSSLLSARAWRCACWLSLLRCLEFVMSVRRRRAWLSASRLRLLRAYPPGHPSYGTVGFSFELASIPF